MALHHYLVFCAPCSPRSECGRDYDMWVNTESLEIHHMSQGKWILWPAESDTVYFLNDSSNFVLQSGWLIDVAGLVFDEWLTDADKTHRNCNNIHG